MAGLSAIVRRLLPFLVLAVLPCLLLFPVVFGGEVFLPAELLKDIAPWRTVNPNSTVPWNPLQWDGMAEFYPWRLFAAQTLKSGYLPLWNPHQFCGTPFVANSQSAVFYPLNLLFCLFPVARAFGISVLVHLFLTGSFMYGFIRSKAMALARPAALLGAVAWQLCHWQVAWLALPTFLCVSAWLPLALLLVDRTAERPAASRAACLGLVLGLMLLAGHLQIAFYCFGLITAYAVFRVLPHVKLHWKPLLGAALLALTLAFGLAAPQILPSVELARVSHRAGGNVNWSAYVGYVRLAVPPVNLVTLLAPGFFGNPTRASYWGVGTNAGPGAYIENACYVGILTLLLAMTALLSTWRTHSSTRFFSIAALVSFLLALGTALNAVLFFGIPGFAQTGSPGRILVLWSFCLPVLAAIGADALLKQYEPKVIRNAVVAFGAAAAMVVLFAVLWISHKASAGALTSNLAEESDLWRMPVGILLGAAAALWFWRRGSFTASKFGGALVVLTAIDLLAAGYSFNRTSAPQVVYPVTPLIEFLQQHKADGRIMPLNKQWGLYSPPPAILPPNSAMVYGLDDTQGYDSLLTRQYFQFAGVMDNGSPAPPENGNMVFTSGFGSREAREANARYAVSLSPISGQTPVYQDGTAYVYEDKKALPRLRTVEGVELKALAGPPSRVTIALPHEPEISQIIAADQWYPGWNVYAGGKAVPLTDGPDIFRTISLSANTQAATVEMRYEPTAFCVGLYAFCLALGMAAAVFAAALTTKLGRSRFR